MPEIVFALAPGQNHFFVEIAEALCGELRDLGATARVARDGLPDPDPGVVPVLVPPHEFFALTPPERHPAPPELQRAIFLCAEQPGTWFFEEDVRLAHLHGAALLDVSDVGVRAFREAGLVAEHVPLGFSRHWACPEADLERERDVDVLHLGIWSRRRAETLARCGRALSRRRAHIVLSDPDHANAAPMKNFVVEEDKWGLLRSARTLLNLHVADRDYFEWQRAVQAISNGALVVTEPSDGVSPLVPGEHFVSARPEALPVTLDAVLSDEPRRLRMARAAYELLRDELPMGRSAERLAAVADERATLPVAPARPVPPATVAAAPAAETEKRRRFPSSVTDPELAALRAALKDVRLELIDQRRELQWLKSGGPLVERVHESAAYAVARPRVSVIVPMHDEAECVTDALDSCTTQTMGDLELVVVDDGSGDASSEAVTRWSRAHAGTPLLLLRHPVNRGLGQARNTAIDHVRAPLTFVLDADNELFDVTLQRLVTELDARPDADFVYSMLAMEANGEPVGLRSCFPWDPGRLATGNYIDAMALWRTESLRELGGYTTELRLHGWEDYDLFCRVAERGRGGVLVPEILGRYRVRGHSMLSITDISMRAAVSLLIERHPTVMRGVEPPL
jgi:glycosyl transferase family 2/glycosyl transferase family 1